MDDSPSGFDQSVSHEVVAPVSFMLKRSAQLSTDLVRGTGIDRSTLADLVNRLETQGYLLRRERSSTDARVNFVFLTALGNEMVVQAKPAAEIAQSVHCIA